MKCFACGPDVTLYRGDAIDVLRTLPAASVDAVVTDPPYGIGFQYGAGREVADDPQAYAAFLLPVIQECRRIARPGAFFAIWQGALNFRHFWTWFGDGIRIYAAAKNFVQLRKTPINYGYDPVVMWYQDGAAVLCPAKQARSVDFFVANTAATVSDRGRIEKAHPCPRPLDAVAEVVRNFTLPGGLILDPFAGSGTTALACVQTGRRFIGVEIDAGYCSLARRRLAAA